MINLLMRGVLGSALALGLAAGLAGCNTVEGFGKDMTAAGRALSASAERNKGDAPATSGAEDAASSTATTTDPAAGASPVTPVTPTPLNPARP